MARQLSIFQLHYANHVLFQAHLFPLCSSLIQVTLISKLTLDNTSPLPFLQTATARLSQGAAATAVTASLELGVPCPGHVGWASSMHTSLGQKSSRAGQAP